MFLFVSVGLLCRRVQDWAVMSSKAEWEDATEDLVVSVGMQVPLGKLSHSGCSGVYVDDQTERKHGLYPLGGLGLQHSDTSSG